MWRANLPDISQRSVNAAAKAAALASVGDKLVDSLQAQSLDLPPQAAKVKSNSSRQMISSLCAFDLFLYMFQWWFCGQISQRHAAARHATAHQTIGLSHV